MSVGPGRSSASCEVVAASASGTFVEFRGGELDGQMLHLPRPVPASTDHDPVGYRPPTPYRELGPAERERADATAEKLLISMLDPHQRRDRARDGRFWVDLGRHGRIRFGTPHHLVHRPPSGPTLERVLCVVPVGAAGDPTPAADVWTTLLLAVRADPEAFLDVANTLGSTPRRDDEWRMDGLSDDQLGRLAEGHYGDGRTFDGAVVEAERAHRAEARGARQATGLAVTAAVSGSAGADVPAGPSATERRERWEATAERLVATTRPGADELARWRRRALDRLERSRSAQGHDATGRADTLISLWTSSI